MLAEPRGETGVMPGNNRASISQARWANGRTIGRETIPFVASELPGGGLSGGTWARLGAVVSAESMLALTGRKAGKQPAGGVAPNRPPDYITCQPGNLWRFSEAGLAHATICNLLAGGILPSYAVGR